VEDLGVELELVVPVVVSLMIFLPFMQYFL
jgi:hypothetical protein